MLTVHAAMRQSPHRRPSTEPGNGIPFSREFECKVLVINIFKNIAAKRQNIS
jgi:hypothetical protein